MYDNTKNVIVHKNSRSFHILLIGTVDRVLHKRGKVSKKALDKVTKVLDEFEYSPNPIARTLKNGIVYCIKVLLPDPQKDHYWIRCLEGLKETIDEFSAFTLDIEIHFYDPTKPRLFSKLGKELAQHENLNALLFVPLFERESQALLNELSAKEILSGTFNSRLSNDLVYQHTGQNLYSSGRVAAKLVHDLTGPGSRIAIIHIDEAFNNAVHMRKKEQGFVSFLKEHDSYEIRTLTLNTNEFQSKFLSFVEQFDPIDAFFVTTSKAYEVVKALRGNEQDYKIVGYDLLSKNIDCLKRGEINFLIHQSPKVQAALGLKGLIEKLIFAKEVARERLLPIDIVNSENVESYLT